MIPGDKVIQLLTRKRHEREAEETIQQKQVMVKSVPHEKYYQSQADFVNDFLS